MNRPEFHPLQAEEIARAFRDAGVDYLFLPLLESFRGEYEKRFPAPLRSAADIASAETERAE